MSKRLKMKELAEVDSAVAKVAQRCFEEPYTRQLGEHAVRVLREWYRVSRVVPQGEEFGTGPIGEMDEPDFLVDLGDEREVGL